MDLQSYEEILIEILKKYNKKPYGWRVLISKDPSGFWDILFTNDDEGTWIAKLDTLFKANPTGLGVKLNEKIEIPKINDASYGFRPIPEPLIKNLTEEIQKSNLSLNEAVKKLIEELKFIQPKPIYEVQQSPITAIGPHHILKASVFSQKQKELNKVLNEHLRKILRKKYPWYNF
ncbi:MAG: hypothetical protein QW476_01980 [Candidatus Bathyarchaeia archaeon]|nr:hypothetical protein [Candidatus Bathyarchaeota archaeon]